MIMVGTRFWPGQIATDSSTGDVLRVYYEGEDEVPLPVYEVSFT